jgi:chromosome segregation ATPase
MKQTKFTILAAAKLYKKSRNTITKDIKNGVLSKNSDGDLELSELLRVYGDAPSAKPVQTQEQYSASLNALIAEREQLIIRVSSLEQQIERYEKREDWLQQQINDLTQQRLTHQQQTPKKGLLARLMG